MKKGSLMEPSGRPERSSSREFNPFGVMKPIDLPDLPSRVYHMGIRRTGALDEDVDFAWNSDDDRDAE